MKALARGWISKQVLPLVFGYYENLQVRRVFQILHVLSCFSWGLGIPV